MRVKKIDGRFDKVNRWYEQSFITIGRTKS